MWREMSAPQSPKTAVVTRPMSPMATLVSRAWATSKYTQGRTSVSAPGPYFFRAFNASNRSCGSETLPGPVAPCTASAW